MYFLLLLKTFAHKSRNGLHSTIAVAAQLSWSKSSWLCNVGILQNGIYMNQIRTWKSCTSVSRRSGTVLISEWLTVQSENGTRDCEHALHLMENISKMHCEHDCFASCFNAARLLDYY